MEKRIDEIDSILEICDENRDSDVIENLLNELDEIMFRLETSLEELENG
jgi:hypothetical protein